ncbi:flavodoxin reductase [Pseudooceanicola sediminis]|uniref:Flavodoxin reductase n=1 Tax=Pseudooceanicola sediminis TaxID=2211117 RepID=A0A399IWY6_9RHOB|nr:FAD-binding oxidoreductase [Pseudooceanicola sediminis]KAA2312892.1 flavodoxin reductase [Puniceibacterium sp. HSS470]RII37708.1 flavodoxin reductase [Pseudooceanicola sediminis]|tara:strand:- start:62262 stop:62933 length:672 start_codon:yes stop_codon:yes gene_type:complete
MAHKLTLKEKTSLTHDVNQYVFTRPEGVEFTPGQATELSLEDPAWQDEGRPFTFTSQPEDSTLEFVIKSYPSHDGVTEQLGALKPGQSVEIVDPFGAISDAGPGTFIAAGAGLTPFIPILRHRMQAGTLKGCRLIYTNKSEADIILREEWEAMRDLETVFTVTDEPGKTVRRARVDQAFLAGVIDDFSQRFYLCGPGDFVDDVRDALKALGAKADRIITEEGW